MKLNKSELEIQQKVENLEHEICQFENEIEELQNKCKHRFVDYDSFDCFCKVCGKLVN